MGFHFLCFFYYFLDNSEDNDGLQKYAWEVSTFTNLFSLTIHHYANLRYQTEFKQISEPVGSSAG